MFDSYEERSLGVFELPPEDEEDEPNLPETISRRERIGKYFGWHLRRQVAYDIWWLVCAIFLICVIERGKIMDDENAPWFNLFRIGGSCRVILYIVVLTSSMCSIRVGFGIRRNRPHTWHPNTELLILRRIWAFVEARCHCHHGTRTPPWLARRNRPS